MRLSRPLYVVLLCALAALLPLHAQQVAPAISPYAVTVPVPDTSEAQRDLAFGDALGQVLTRVAGGQDLRDKPGYGDALKGAAGLVQRYQYQRAGSGLALQVSFDQGSVRRLITRLGVAAAGVKPPVLALVQGADGALLGKDSLTALAQAAAARGYTLAYPDPAHAPDQARVAAADPAALAAVADQYKTGLILLGALKSGGSSWTLVSGGQAQRWNETGTSEDAMLTEAGSGLADRLGKQLNVIASGVTESKLWVSDVGSALDYARMLAALQADPSVRQVTTVGAQGNGMLLDIKAMLPAPALAASLAASGRLIQGDSHPGADASLRWLH
jgi:hypothetical protein